MEGQGIQWGWGRIYIRLYEGQDLQQEVRPMMCSKADRVKKKIQKERKRRSKKEYVLRKEDIDMC